MMTPRHKNTLFHQNFPVKTVTTSTYMKTCNFDMKKQYQKCKGKIISEHSLSYRERSRDRHIPFERSVPRVI